jgi:hypothetical protein
MEPVSLSYAAQFMRSKVAAALLAILPIGGVPSEAQITPRDEPPASSSTDLGALTLPRVDQGSSNDRAAQVTLRSGFIIPQGDKTAKYSLSEDGRVNGIAFPSGYTISRITYHTVAGSEDRIASLSITAGRVTKTYTRNIYRGQLYSSWKVSGPGIAQDSRLAEFNGDFAVTSSGEFVITDLSKSAAAGGAGSRVFTSEEKSFVMARLGSGGYRYLYPNGDLHGVRRADLSLVTRTYSNGKCSAVTEELRDGTTRVWKLESSSGLWHCSDRRVSPSERCPLFERGTLSYMTVDGSRVNIATSGAKTITHSDGITVVIDQREKIHRVAKGARSRVFTYSESGSLASFADYQGSSKAHSVVMIDPSCVWRIEPDGTVLLDAGGTSQASQATLKSPIRYESLVNTAPDRKFSLPPMLIHPHDRKNDGPKLCLPGVCPSTPPSSSKIGVFLPIEAIATGQESLVLPEIASWTSLDTIKKHRAGRLAFIVDFLRCWAEKTSDEDIDMLTSSESLHQLCGSGGTPWIQPELLSPANADFLIWLRDCIQANKLPCSIDIQVLNYPGAVSQFLYGGVTQTQTSPIDDELMIGVVLQALIYEEAQIRADIEAMKTHGGLGVYRPDRFQISSVFDVIFHELYHVFIYSTGREFEGGEPAAHLGAFLALASISPEDAQRYEGLLKRFGR